MHTLQQLLFHITPKEIFMKTTNKSCSTFCSSYSDQPEPGFYLCSIKAGETFVIEPDDTNRLLFLRSGRFLISSVECHNYQIRESHVAFCSRSHRYVLVAEGDCEILVARFVSANIVDGGETSRSIAAEVSKINYHFSSISLNDVLSGFVESVVFFLKHGVRSQVMHRAKIDEMFVIFRYFYPRETYLRTFYSLFNNSMSFRALVVSNAPNAKNVETLAKMCGHSLSHFKLLFSQHFDQTPYVWMQQHRAVEIAQLLADTSIPLKSIIKRYGFTSHGHFSLFCRKFLGDTPRVLRRNNSPLVVKTITIEDVKRNLAKARAVPSVTAVAEAPRRRGRPRKA